MGFFSKLFGNEEEEEALEHELDSTEEQSVSEGAASGSANQARNTPPPMPQSVATPPPPPSARQASKTPPPPPSRPTPPPAPPGARIKPPPRPSQAKTSKGRGEAAPTPVRTGDTEAVRLKSSSTSPRHQSSTARPASKVRSTGSTRPRPTPRTTDRRSHNGARPPRPGRDDKLFDDILGEASDAFDNLQQDAPSPSTPGRLANDATAQREVTELFAQVAATHTGQVRNFMLELSMGETTKQWAELCRPALKSLENAAREMELPKLVQALEDLDRELDHVMQSSEARIRGPLRDQLLSRYGKLCKLLPTTFELAKERDRREPIIVHTLLEQVPTVHKVAIDRLYSAGVASLDTLYGATVDDLSAAANISPDVARAVVDRVQQYRDERAKHVFDSGDPSSRNRLRAVVESLRGRHQEFCEADEDDDRERKRSARRARTALIQDIRLLLAQMGETEMVHEIDRAPVHHKIERVSEYLSQSTRSAPRH